MELTKLNPWNWFKNEEEQTPSSLPVQRHSPSVHPALQLHQEIDRLFDNAFRNFGFPSRGFESQLNGLSHSALLRPNVDIASSDKEYTITVEVPGVEEDNIKLELAGNTLTIKGEKKQESEQKDHNFYRVERSYGSFQRVLSLPDDVLPDAIEAQFNNGVLTISLPREVISKPEGKVIEIKKAA